MPSQVYFPSAASGANELDQPKEQLEELLQARNHDLIATQRIFEMLARTSARGNYQIIVLEHADQAIWGGLAVEVANWKGMDDGLIPAARRMGRSPGG